MDRMHRPIGRLGASLLILGAGSAAAQLVLLRELMSVFGGNELVTGTALGIWLLLSGAGSAAGALVFRRARARSVLPWLHMAAGLLPLLLLGMVRAAPLVLGVRGQMLGLPAALGTAAILFLPAGFVAGAIIPLAGRIWAEETRTYPAHASRRVYSMDSTGDAIGGLLFSLILVHLLPHGWVLAIFGWLNLALVPILATSWPAALRIALPAAAAAGLCMAGEFDSRTAAWRYPGQTILERGNTPYAELAVTRSGDQITVFQDAVPVYSSGDLSAEARIHPALAQIPEGAGILLVGGGVFGGLEEAVKHRPERIDYVELDPAVLQLGGLAADGNRVQTWTGSSGSTADVRPRAGDGRLFLKGQRSAYDAILVFMPAPRTMQGNRYYTLEFFREVRRALRPGGVFSFPFPASPNYLGPEQIALQRTIYSALRRSFDHVEVLPGETHIYLASDKPVELDLEAILEERGVGTVRLLDYDWPEYSDPLRRDQLTGLLDGKIAPGQLVPAQDNGYEAERGPGLASPNRDLSPKAFEALLRLHARITAGNREIAWILGAVFLIVAVGAMRRSRSGWIVGSTGFSAMALQLEALLIYQILLGNLYLRLSLFVTLFLIGVAVGSHWIRLRPEGAWKRIRQADAAILLAALALIGLAHLGTRMPDVRTVRLLADGVLPGLVLCLAMAAGAQFAAAGMVAAPAPEPSGPNPASEKGATGAQSVGKSTGQDHAGEHGSERAGSLVAGLYLADLAGAASGTIAAGLLLLPNFGVAGVTIAVIAVKGASLLAWMRK